MYWLRTRHGDQRWVVSSSKDGKPVLLSEEKGWVKAGSKATLFPNWDEAHAALKGIMRIENGHEHAIVRLSFSKRRAQ